MNPLDSDLDLSEDASYYAGEPVQKEDVKIMSLRLAICILCLLCVLSGAVASMVIVTVGSNKAVDDSLDLADLVEKEWEKVSLQSLKNTSASLLDYSSTLIESYVGEYFSLYTSEGLVLKNTLEGVHATRNTSDWNFWIERSAEDFARVKALGRKGLEQVQVVITSGDNIGIVAYSGENDPDAVAKGTYICFRSNLYGPRYPVTRNGVQHFSKPLDLYRTFPNSSALMFRYFSFNITMSAADTYLLASAMPADLPWWTPPIYNQGSVAILYYIVRFPFNGVDVRLIVGTWLSKVSDMLSDVAIKVRGDKNLKLRLYTVVASDPSTALFEAYHNEPTPFAKQVGILTGVSNGAAATTTCRPHPILVETCAESPNVDVSAEDSIIRGVALAVHNESSYEETSKGVMILNVSHLEGPGGVLLNSTLNGTVQETFFVISRRANGTLGAGLDWWIVTALDTHFVQGAVEAKMVENVEALKRDRDTITSDIAANRIIAIVAVGAVCVLLIVIANVATVMMLRPFLALQEDMERVANMEFLTNKLAPTSIFHEVFTMQRSFFTMAQNLKEFKAYVPEAVLDGGTVVDPPKGNVAIVFTDIQGSTALWDRSPYGMNNALELHNETMREVCKEVGGYEVKTIGDAFMIAFPDATKGVQFCLEVQTRLTQHQWSPELELPQRMRNDGSGYLWNGLRVRMGCHYGDVILEDNPLTGRSDYRGTTVNTASRLEAKSLAGAVCVTESVFSKLNMNTLGNPSFQGHGVHELKGLGTGHKLNVIAPRPLAERFKPEEQATTSNSTARKKSDVSSVYSKASVDVKEKEKKMLVGLTNSVVTVAVCRMSETRVHELFDSSNLAIGVVGEAALQTDGIVVNVLGRHITIAWNTAKPNKLHVMSAVRFASQLEQRYSSVVTIGLATGKVLHGNVGSVKSRFHNMYGVPLEMAEMLASYANTARTFALMADGTEGKVAAVSQVNTCLRIVDVWEEASTNVVYNVLEVMCNKMRRMMEETWEDSAPTNSNNNDEVLEFNQKYLQVLKGDVEAVNALQAAGSYDNTALSKRAANTVCNLIQESKGNAFRITIKLGELPEGLC